MAVRVLMLLAVAAFGFYLFGCISPTPLVIVNGYQSGTNTWCQIANTIPPMNRADEQTWLGVVPLCVSEANSHGNYGSPWTTYFLYNSTTGNYMTDAIAICCSTGAAHDNEAENVIPKASITIVHGMTDNGHTW